MSYSALTVITPSLPVCQGHSAAGESDALSHVLDRPQIVSSAERSMAWLWAFVQHKEAANTKTHMWELNVGATCSATTMYPSSPCAIFKCVFEMSHRVCSFQKPNGEQCQEAEEWAHHGASPVFMSALSPRLYPGNTFHNNTHAESWRAGEKLRDGREEVEERRGE